MRSENIHEQEIIEKQGKRCYSLKHVSLCCFSYLLVGDSHYWGEQQCWIENAIRDCNSRETNIAKGLQSSTKASVQKQQFEESIQKVFVLQIEGFK